MNAARDFLSTGVSARYAIPGVVAAYGLFTAGALLLLLVVGGWAVLLVPGIAGAFYLALDLFRASLPLFVTMPPLDAPYAVAGLVLWYASFGILLAAWLLACVRGRVSVPLHYVALYAAFMIAVIASLTFGVDPALYLLAEGSGKHFHEQVLQPLLVSATSILFIPALADRGRLRGLAWVVVLAGVVITTTIFFMRATEVRGLGPFDSHRPTGLFNTPHHAGLFAIFYLLLAVALFGLERRGPRRVFLVGAASVFVAGIYATGSRSIWATLALVLVLGLLPYVREVARRVRFAHALALVTLGVLSLLFVAGRMFPAALEPPVREVPPFWTGRIALVKLGLDLFVEHPLTGVGQGNHILLIPAQLVPVGYQGSRIHTHFAVLLAETGILGFVTFMLIVGMTLHHFIRATRAFRVAGDRELHRLTRAYLLTFVAIMLVSLTHGDIGQRLFWALVAIALGTRRLAAELSVSADHQPAGSRSTP